MKFLLLIFTVSIIVACQPISSNEEIDDSVAKTIDGLNEKFFELTKAEDYKNLRLMASDLFIDSTENIIDFFKVIKTEFLDSCQVSKLEQHHSKHIKEGMVSRFTKDNYVIEYACATKQSVFTNFSLRANNGVEAMFATIFGKYGDEWLMDAVRVGTYRLNNKNAMQYFGESVDFYSNGHLVDAAISGMMAQHLKNPLVEMMTYNNDDRMIAHFNTVLEESNAKYNFPFEINELEFKPVMLSIDADIFDQEILPKVYYKSQVPNFNTKKIEEEARQIHDYLAELLEGFADNNPKIIYEAMEEIPDGINTVNTHITIIE